MPAKEKVDGEERGTIATYGIERKAMDSTHERREE